MIRKGLIAVMLVTTGIAVGGHFASDKMETRLKKEQAKIEQICPGGYADYEWSAGNPELIVHCTPDCPTAMDLRTLCWENLAAGATWRQIGDYDGMTGCWELLGDTTIYNCKEGAESS